MPMFGFGFGGPRRGGGFGGGFFLLFLIIMMGPGILLPTLLTGIIPLAVVGFGIYAIVKAIESANAKPKAAKYTSTNAYRKNETSKVNVSNADIARIDKKLSEYFKNNIELPVIQDISLVTQGGKYQSVDNLFVAYKNEKVVKLGDFKFEHPDMYNKIYSLILSFSKLSTKDMAAKVEVKEETKGEILSNADKYIEKINALNDAIPQEEISNSLYQTCDLLAKIDKSKQSKTDETKLNKLYDYYLPILTGILENYRNLQDNAVKGDEFTKCESQLIKTIMLINEALKTLYMDMHEDDYLNINADINTLQTLLEKDGYGEDPFAKKEK